MSGAIISFSSNKDEGTNPPQIVEYQATNDDLVDLMQGVCEKDQQAFTRLYHLTVDRVFALARFVLKNPQDAEEVTTDVYAQVWDVADRYDADRGTVMAWLLMRCRSRALDLIRRRSVRTKTVEKARAMAALDEDGVEESPEDILNHVQEGTAVHRALCELTPQRREVLTLAYFRGMSHLEIADTTGLPVGTVKSHVRRAIQTLRRHLDTWEAS